MPPTIVSDTSCLILLQQLDELHLLQKLFGTIIITTIVAEEFGEQLPTWVIIENPQDKRQENFLGTLLHKGEASAITLAMEKGNCLLIIDEHKGRRMAKNLDLIITGTLGVLAQAKLKGHIDSLRLILEKVKQTNFRLNEDLIVATLKQVGE